MTPAAYARRIELRHHVVGAAYLERAGRLQALAFQKERTFGGLRDVHDGVTRASSLIRSAAARMSSVTNRVVVEISAMGVEVYNAKESDAGLDFTRLLLAERRVRRGGIRYQRSVTCSCRWR